MGRRALRGFVGIPLLAAVIFVMSGSAQAWYSPVNTLEQSAPPAAPGLLGQTRCLIQSMDGNIYGVAFAKVQAVNGYCSTVQSTVVYGSLQVGTPGPVEGCCYTYSQSTQAGSSVFGGFFSVTVTDNPLTLLTQTSVFP